MDSEDLQAALAKFTRSLKHYRHWSRAYFYTDGVAFLVEHAGAHWLLDHIAARQKRARKDRMLREAQVWTLRMTGPITAHVGCSREDGTEVFYDEVPVFGGFPLDEVTLIFENETLMLKGERA
jgi:hypothetical protein